MFLSTPPHVEWAALCTAGSVAVLLREIGCAVGVTSVGVGLRNRAAFVVELLA